MMQADHLEPGAVLVRREDVAMRTLDDQAILLCPETRRPFRLNEAGARIWEMMGRPRRVEDLVAAIQDSYGIDRSVAFSDVAAFLDRLLSSKLITRV